MEARWQISVSDEGADTGKGGVERLCDRKRLFHGAAKSLLRDLQRIQTVILRCGNAVGASRQNFTQRTHRSRYVFDAVDDSAVRIAENDIAPLAHQLHDQGFLTQVAHLVQVLDLEVDDALHVRLADLHDPSVCDMLAQKHAEIRRGERTLVCWCRSDIKRQGSARRHGEAVLTVRSFKAKSSSSVSGCAILLILHSES